MIRNGARLVLLMGFLGLAGYSRGAELEVSSTDRILILAPHPDDEVLCCAGVIQKAVQLRVPLKIVFFTLGDNNAWAFSIYSFHPVFRPKAMRRMGTVEWSESLAAAKTLGVTPDQLISLGYPNFGTLIIWNEHWDRSPAYESRMTRVQAVPYTTAYRPGAAYKGEEILRDLDAILKDFHPTKIFVPHPADLQRDHQVLYLFLRVVLWDLANDRAPEVYLYLVHFHSWPPQRGLHKDRTLDPPSVFSDQSHWIAFPLTAPQEDKKCEALEKHRTQWVYSRHFLKSFVRRNELFESSASWPASALVPPEISEQRKEIDKADFEEWQVTVDSKDLVITGRLSRRLRESREAWVSAFGYRRDTPFEKMPKIRVEFRSNHFLVYDQLQPVLDPNVQVERDHRQFTVRIPLHSLGQPEKVITSCGLTKKLYPFDWNSWQIIELPGASTVFP